MRRCLFSILLWTISTSALAPAGIPACAQSAISSGIQGSSCAIDDYSCICASENFKFALESADDACNEADKEILYNVLWKFCSGTVLGTRDVNEDDASAGEGDVQDDTPSPTVASEGTDMNTLGTSVITATPTVASEGTDMSTLNTPVVASTPTIASEGTDQATLGTPVPAGTATVATEGTDQATLSTPTVIAPPTTPLPTTATSIATDTREFFHPSHLDSSNVVTTQQAAGR
jgi:hypothetical protein